MRRFSVNLPRSALLTIYKSFIRPHLDYGDILYDRKKIKKSKIQSMSEKKLAQYKKLQEKTL